MAMLVIFTVLAGIASGYLSSIFFNIHDLALAPGFIFGLMTSWFALSKSDYKLASAVGWIISSALSFYVALLIGMGAGLINGPIGWFVAGFVGASLLATASHLLFGKITKKQGLITAMTGGVVAAISSLFDANNHFIYLFILWQPTVAVTIVFTFKDQMRLK